MTDDEFWQTERGFWLDGAGASEGRLAAGCMMAFTDPAGIMDRAAALAGLAGAPRWQSLGLADRRLSRTGDAVAVLAYRATAARAGEPPYRALCTSTNARDGDRWLLVQHQQTPAG